MQLTLGYQTDLIFHGFDGLIKDRGNCLVVETPSNPTFFWGNLLIFNAPPEPGACGKWVEAFKNEFKHNPAIKHCTLAWISAKGEKGSVNEFIADGFDFEESIILGTQKLNPPKHVNDSVDIRTLSTETEWEEMIQAQVDTRPEDHSFEHFSRFKRAQVARYRAMVNTGLGQWFAAYLDGRQVANLGVFVKDGIARYQQVITHPSYQRRGICGTLVWKSGEYALNKMGAKTLVMVADENYHAARIYESVGFRPIEKQLGVCKWERGAL